MTGETDSIVASSSGVGRIFGSPLPNGGLLPSGGPAVRVCVAFAVLPVRSLPLPASGGGYGGSQAAAGGSRRTRSASLRGVHETVGPVASGFLRLTRSVR